MEQTLNERILKTFNENYKWSNAEDRFTFRETECANTIEKLFYEEQIKLLKELRKGAFINDCGESLIYTASLVNKITELTNKLNQ